MENGDIELGGFLMGKGRPVFATSLQIGPAGDRQQDADEPFTDVRRFGRDQRTAPTWSFEFSVGEDTGQAPDVGVLAALEQLATTWRTAVDATLPGTVVPLRYKIGDRIRRVYGRPRNFGFNPSAGISSGNIIATADFALQDSYYYDDALQENTLELREPPNGWVTLPAVWPLVSTISSTREGFIQVAGSGGAMLEDITFYGPVSNPKLVTGDWTVQLNDVAVPYDGWIRVDPRARTVLNQAGGSLGGKLSRKTHLPDLVLRPGPQEFAFTGLDPTGSARAVVRWRSAYNAL